MFRIERSEARPPPIVPTVFPPIEPVEPAPAAWAPAYFTPAEIAQPPRAAAQPAAVAMAYAAASSPLPRMRRSAFANVLPMPAPHFYAPVPALDEWPLSRMAATSMPPLRSAVTGSAQSIPAALGRNNIDRLQLTAWAMLRSQQAGVAGTPSLASGGTLGASQAGSRLTYNFTRRIAASLRTTSEIGRRGAEIAAGVRVQPVGGLPLWITAERRQRLGSNGDGRNDFALFFESGVYRRPMPWRFALDAYLQGGVVGTKRRDGFIDGGLTLTRPVYRNFSAGFGVWGGAQPGVARLDAGPRLSMRVRNNVGVHFDWRQRIAGNARPDSGPAVTLAGDF
jgi:hypothetical protein